MNWLGEPNMALCGESRGLLRVLNKTEHSSFHK